MRRVLAVVIVLTAFFAVTVPASAESWHSVDISSGECGFGYSDGTNFYFGSGTYQVVATSSGQSAQICQGVLDPSSDVPARAIRLLDFGAPGVNLVITPSGAWNFVDQSLP